MWSANSSNEQMTGLNIYKPFQGFPFGSNVKDFGFHFMRMPNLALQMWS